MYMYINNGYRGSFLGEKRQGRGADHPPQSSVDVKEWVELYLDSLSVPSVACYGVTFTFTCTFTAG
jgi:hypothetical protein